MSSSTRILVLADETRVRHDAASILRSAEYEVDAAPARADASPVARVPGADLVLIHASRSDALALCRELRANPLFGAAIALFSSGPDWGGLPPEEVADDVIAWPADPCDFVARVRLLLRARGAEEALRRIAQVTEHEVAQRTADLRRANENLEASLEESTHAEARYWELSLFFRLLGNVSKVIARVSEPRQLFTEVCRIAVEDGRFRMAWVGLVDPETLDVQPAAHWGFEEGYLQGIRVSAADVPEGQGPTGTAIREGRRDVCNDWDTEPRMEPWRREARLRGYCSSAAFPLRAAGRVVGAITLYARERDYFSEARVGLLSAIADDLSFALDAAAHEEQRLAAEKALAESRERLELALAGSQSSMWHWDMLAGDVEHDGRWCEIVGPECTRRREDRTEWEARIHPDDWKVTRAALDQYLAGNASFFEMEYRIRTCRGDWRWVMSRGRVVARDESGNPTRMAGTVFDITRHKLAEQRLEEQAHMLDLAHVLVRDLEGRVLFWNRGAERLYGWPREEALGSDLGELLDTLYPEPAASIQHQVLENGSWEGELVHTRRDGRRVVVASHWIPYTDASGRPLGIVEVNNDITERRRVEEALRRSEESHRDLAERLRALSAYLQRGREDERIRIAREIHDELGQMLTGINIDVNWIARRLADPPESRDASKILARIRSVSELAKDATRALRRIATDLRPGVLDDLGLVAAIEWQAAEFQERTGIRCKLMLSDVEGVDVPPEQATALFRIFQEALANAGRHSGAQTILVRLSRDEGDVVLDVRDDGKGLTPEQIHGSRSLGLLGMRERAHLAGGLLTITGAPGMGTRVVARVPLRPSALDAPDVLEQ